MFEHFVTHLLLDILEAGFRTGFCEWTYPLAPGGNVNECMVHYLRLSHVHG